VIWRYIVAAKVVVWVAMLFIDKTTILAVLLHPYRLFLTPSTTASIVNLPIGVKLKVLAMSGIG
jgi:hypothetical protein